MLRRLREWLDRAHSPRAPAPPDLAELEAPESGPSDDAPAPPGDDAVVVMPIDDAIDLHTFAPRDVASVVEEYLYEAQLRGFREVRMEPFLTRAVRLYERIDRTGLMRSGRSSTPETPGITAT